MKIKNDKQEKKKNFGCLWFYIIWKVGTFFLVELYLVGVEFIQIYQISYEFL